MPIIHSHLEEVDRTVSTGKKHDAARRRTEEEYIGEDGLLYCGKCNEPKEAYFDQKEVGFLGIKNICVNVSVGDKRENRRNSIGNSNVMKLWSWN